MVRYEIAKRDGRKKEMTPEQKQKAREVGARIRTAREQKGYTQKQLSITVGLSDGAAAQWETGRVIPSLKNLTKIAQALDTTSEYLFAGDAPEEQAKAHTKLERALLRAARKHPREKLLAVLNLLGEEGPATEDGLSF